MQLESDSDSCRVVLQTNSPQRNKVTANPARVGNVAEKVAGWVAAGARNLCAWEDAETA